MPKKYNVASVAGHAAMRCCSAVSAAYDTSTLSRLAAAVRCGAAGLRLRVAGTFLITFGLYGALVSALGFILDGREIWHQLYFCASLVILSIPLLLSEKSISAALLYSAPGAVICDWLGIRHETLEEGRSRGRANIAFLLGVVCGTATFFVSPEAVIWTVLAVIGCGIIMTIPEAAAVICALLLPTGFTAAEVFVIAAGIISFLFKLIRGKRSEILSHCDMAAIIFVLAIAPGAVTGSAATVMLALSYFIISFALGGLMRAYRVLTAAVAVTGAVSAVFAAAMFVGAEDLLLSVGAAGELTVTVAMLIPAAVYVLICGKGMPRFTTALCMLSMLGFLVLSSAAAELIAAFIAAVVMLTVLHRRAAYLLISASGLAAVLYAYFGGDPAGLLSKLFMQSPHTGGGLTTDSLFGLLFGAGMENGFEAGFLRCLGLLGAVCVAFMLVCMTASLIRLGCNSFAADTQDFPGALACACGALVMLLCALGRNVWAGDMVYLGFWLLCGIFSSFVRRAEEKAARRYGALRAREGAGAAEAIITKNRVL